MNLFGAIAFLHFPLKYKVIMSSIFVLSMVGICYVGSVYSSNSIVFWVVLGLFLISEIVLSFLAVFEVIKNKKKKK